MDQGVIQMFKAHYLQKTWHALRLKCDVSLSELEKATQASAESEVELQKNVVRRHWLEFAIRDTIWHVRDAWKEVMQSCISRAWKRLCPQLATDFKGFDLTEKLLKECLELAKKVGLDELEEEDVDSLLETIGEELSMEDLDELEKQRLQLEEEMEAEQQPMAPSMMRYLTVKTQQCFYVMLSQTIDYPEEIDPDVERAGLARHKVCSDLAQHDQMLYEKRVEAS